MKERLYRFRKSKQLGKYQVMFKHIPGKWISTGKTEIADAVLFAEDFLQKELGGHKGGKTTLREFEAYLAFPATVDTVFVILTFFYTFIL